MGSEMYGFWGGGSDLRCRASGASTTFESLGIVQCLGFRVCRERRAPYTLVIRFHAIRALQLQLCGDSEAGGKPPA